MFQILFDHPIHNDFGTIEVKRFFMLITRVVPLHPAHVIAARQANTLSRSSHQRRHLGHVVFHQSFEITKWDPRPESQTTRPPSQLVSEHPISFILVSHNSKTGDHTVPGSLTRPSPIHVLISLSFNPSNCLKFREYELP